MHSQDTPRRRRGRRPLSWLLVLGLLGGGIYGYVRYLASGPSRPAGVNDVTPAAAMQQATLARQEGLRIMQTNAVLTSTLRKGGPRAAAMRQPQVFSSANGRTLVLPQRSQPYYIADLEQYARRDFQHQSDGSYLLGVNVFLASGAKLVLQNAAGPLTIRMRSVPGAFTSIVGYGASIRINGSAQNPVRITSWDTQAGRSDGQVTDGRAYIRAIGGDFRMKYAQVVDLGFWSGPTGGIALTGSDRPNSAAGQVAVGSSPPKRVLLPDGTVDSTRGGRDDVGVAGTGKSQVGAVFTVPTANLVTGSVESSRITGNAYGIFVSGSLQAQIVGDRIENSLVHGILLHRFAKNASVESTTVVGSRGDGIVLSRATEAVRITGCTSERNGGNGFTLNGQPLAGGPSASGESLRSYGDSSVSSSTARDNGRYGIEVLGGLNVAVQTSTVSGGDMGIVVGDKATGVQISGNQVRGQARQGIALRGGVSGAKVAGNIVHNAETAIYVRDSSASITGNTVQSAARHGVTLIGTVGGTRVSGNTFSGAGTSALDGNRARGPVAITGNDLGGWHNTAGFWTEAGRIAKPMNIIWASVFLLVIFSAYRSRSTDLRIGRLGAHPYDKQSLLQRRPALALAQALARSAGDTHPDRARPDRNGSLNSGGREMRG